SPRYRLVFLLIAPLRGGCTLLWHSLFLAGPCRRIAMNIIRREPFAETEDFIRSFFPPQISRWLRLGADNGSTGTEWAPVADTSETEKEYLVKAELPGVRREDVHVTLEDGVLSIRGECKQEKEH